MNFVFGEKQKAAAPPSGQDSSTRLHCSIATRAAASVIPPAASAAAYPGQGCRGTGYLVACRRFGGRPGLIGLGSPATSGNWREKAPPKRGQGTTCALSLPGRRGRAQGGLGSRSRVDPVSRGRTLGAAMMTGLMQCSGHSESSR
jgi:hypothetical protein